MLSPKSASKVEDVVTQALTAISKEVADATRRRAAINWLELKNALKQVSTHVEMESQGAISRTCPELERYDSEALRSVVSCRTLLRSVRQDQLLSE